jgi:MoxR-like ATPase
MTVQPSDASFSGATRYVLDEELAQIVNISMALEMPLLLKGNPVRERPCWPTPLPRA